jgi:hypothetical protein
MDPKAALDMAASALKRRDYEVAGEHLEAYWEWRRAGGFQPKGGDRKAERLGIKLSEAWEGGESGWGEAGGVENEGYENPAPKLKLQSVERYRASAAERRRYGGKTVTVFLAMPTEDPATWFKVTGYGKMPADRKRDAKAKAEDICRQGQPGGPISHWKIPGCSQPQHKCKSKKNPKKKTGEKAKKRSDAKAILRRAMRGT